MSFALKLTKNASQNSQSTNNTSDESSEELK